MREAREAGAEKGILWLAEWDLPLLLLVFGYLPAKYSEDGDEVLELEEEGESLGRPLVLPLLQRMRGRSLGMVSLSEMGVCECEGAVRRGGE